MLILIVEDDASVSRFLVRGLREEGYTVDLCEDGSSAEEQALRQPYDAIILDWSLPDGDGLSLLRGWRARGMSAPTLMLTARVGVEATVLALDSGADDYLSKPFSFEELLARLRALARRVQASAQASQLALFGAQVDLKGRRVSRGGDQHELSNREFALLDALLQRRGEVVSRTKLLERVWGLSHDPSTNVVEVYIRYLRQKIDQEGAPSMIETVRGRGYRLRVEERGEGDEEVNEDILEEGDR